MSSPSPYKSNEIFKKRELDSGVRTLKFKALWQHGFQTLDLYLGLKNTTVPHKGYESLPIGN